MGNKFGFSCTFLIQVLIIECAGQYEEWRGGDWAADIVSGTEKPVETTNEWDNYLQTLGEDYEEYPDPENTRKPFVGPDENKMAQDPPDWYPLAPYEDPYLAVVYRKAKGPPDSIYKKLFPDDPEPRGSYIAPGTACGGAFITRQHVLVPCGCLVTFLATLLREKSPFPPGESTYDIYDKEEKHVPKIYVAQVVLEFEPNFKHEIDTDPNKLPKWTAVNCRDLLLQIETLHKQDWDNSKKIAELNGYLTLLPFKPALRQDNIVNLPKWPPIVVNRDTDGNFKARVRLISIGMNLAKPGRIEFFSSISGSILVMKHCNAVSLVCNTTRVHLHRFHTCLCPLRPPDYKLYGGVIGWPVVQGGSLVGTTGSERHSTDATVMLNVLHPELNKRIEEIVSKELLENQNTRPPIFRNEELEKKFVIYDYGEHKEETGGPKQQSNRSPRIHAGPTILVSSTAITFCIISQGRI